MTKGLSMAHSIRLPKVKTECIPYIEGCGWKFTHYDAGMRLYVFKGENGRRTMGGSNVISFTITEIRHAFSNGW